MIKLKNYIFTTKNAKRVIVYRGGGAPEGQIHFVASKDFSNIDFFQNITRANRNYNFSNLEVYINGELTSQVASSISANANDDVVIKATRGKYPWFGHYAASNISSQQNINYIKSIEEPFPLMYTNDGNPIKSFDHCFFICSNLTSIPENLFANNPQVTDFSYCFYNCTRLTSIPEGLFDNNPQVTDFSYYFSYCSSLTSIPVGLFDNNTQVTNFNGCFDHCSSLTSIPEGLFDNNTQVTSFYSCFYKCSGLTSIPVGLFDNNTQVTSFRNCFYNCSSLTVNVQIGSTASSVDVYGFAGSTKSKGTVYCRAGSAAYNAFAGSSNANVNVLTY